MPELFTGYVIKEQFRDKTEGGLDKNPFNQSHLSRVLTTKTKKRRYT